MSPTNQKKQLSKDQYLDVIAEEGDFKQTMVSDRQEEIKSINESY